MTSKQFKNITTALKWSLVGCGILLLWLTREAVIETENWNLFDLDFTKREGVISAYSSLLAAVLSFIAILFVLLDLFYQRRIKESEKEDALITKVQEHRDNLSIIQLFTTELKQDAVSFYDSLIEYSEKEKEHHTEMNRLGFLPNTYPKLILDVDRVRFYEAMKYYKPSDDWKKLYVDLYKLVDYYDKSFDELRLKHQIHLDKKFKHSRDITEGINSFIDNAMAIRNEVIAEYRHRDEDIMTNNYYPLLQRIKELVTEITSNQPTDAERVEADFINPSSIMVWHNTVFQPVFNTILALWNEHGQDSYNLKSIHVKAQALIREYLRLKQDSFDYATHIEDYAKRYFKEDCKQLSRLTEINKALSNI